MSEIIETTQPARLSPIMTAEQEAEFIAGITERRERDAAARLRSTPVVPPAPVPVITREPTICGICGQEFDGLKAIIGDLPPLRKLYCDPCVFARAAASSAPAARQRPSDAWARLCEPEFRTVDEGGSTVFSRLSRDCPRLLEVTGWKFGPLGMLIRGSTGKCKTRAVWRLLREQFDAGRSIVAVTSGSFARDFADAAGNHTHGAWFNRIANADIVFMDDLGRKPWTENVWGEFFELIDFRAKNHKPFIGTTNETSETLALKCKDLVTWAPLNRRLTESCKLIAL